MHWADNYIESLKKHNVIDFAHPNDNKICTMVPVAPESQLKTGDVILCIIAGTPVLTVISNMEKGKYRVVSPEKEGILISKDAIYGKCVYQRDK